jgi:hypothetical protein
MSSCASSLNQYRRLESRTLYPKADGTGLWHQYKKYYRCRVVFTCHEIIKEEWPYSDTEKMKWFAAKGFVLKVSK